MTCEECEIALLENGHQSCKDAEEHLASCPECRRFKRTLELVAQMPALPPELDRQTQLMAKDAMRFQKRRTALRRVILAATACLVAMLALAIHVFQPQRQVKEIPEVAVAPADTLTDKALDNLAINGLDVDIIDVVELQTTLADAKSYLNDGSMNESWTDDEFNDLADSVQEIFLETPGASFTSELDSLELLVYGL